MDTLTSNAALHPLGEGEFAVPGRIDIVFRADLTS